MAQWMPNERRGAQNIRRSNRFFLQDTISIFFRILFSQSGLYFVLALCLRLSAGRNHFFFWFFRWTFFHLRTFFFSVGFLESQEICGKCRQASKKLFNELVGTIFKRSMILGIFHIIVIVRAYIFSLSLHSNLLSICMPNRPKERKWTKASISHSNTLSILK